MSESHIPARPVSSGFRYTPLTNPLTEIRLAILEPALSDDDEIRCQLHTVDIAEAKYESLSYAWGDESVKVPIIFCGQPFLVTANLAHALRNLRFESSDPKKKRALWIDALCIDQLNPTERSEQVQRMGSIYKSADNVLVWLGNYYEPEDETLVFTQDAWGFTRLDPGNLQTTLDAFRLFKDLNQNYRSTLRKLLHLKTTLSLDPKCWGYLCTICQRSWFTRLWIVQEVAKAKKCLVHCGRAQIEWEALDGAAEMMAIYLESPDDGAVASLRFLIEASTLATTISVVALWNTNYNNSLSIIDTTSASKATDPRDRLYAIQGLLSPEDTDIQVDYTKNMIAAYKHWALRRMDRTKTLDTLTLCLYYGAEENGEKLPSWVPDLRYLFRKDYKLVRLANGIQRDDRNPAYNAGGHQDVEPLFQLQELEGKESALQLKGFAIDTIVKGVDNEHDMALNYAGGRIFATIDAMEKQICEHFGVDNLPDEIYEAFVDSIFVGYSWYAERSLTETLRARFKVWRGRSEIPADFEPTKSQPERRRAFLGKIDMIAAGMVEDSELFITARGFIGTASRHCRADGGAKVYVLLGGSAPFILQPLKGGNDHRLLCACFLHGYMDGEAISAWKKGELDLQTVNLV